MTLEGKGLKIKKPQLRGLGWCGAGSNRRHKDFQSFALPTELPHLDTLPILYSIGEFRTGGKNREILV